MSILVQQSEATAAYRRMYFHCVDATDGLTPETGEAAGQPQISVNGGAWGNTTNTLTAIGNGRYYVEITAAELGTLGIIEGRYKSANTAEALGTTLQVVPYDPYDGVRMGLTALPNAVAEASGGLYTRGSGAGQINQDNNGEIDVDVQKWLGTAAATPTVAGVPEVDLTHLMGAILTEGGAGRLAAAFIKLFDVASPTGTVNSLPDAVPDAAGGIPVSDAGGLDLDAILADTKELQENQGAWATAIGFSTHNATAVWNVATRILTANTNFNDPTAAAIATAILGKAIDGTIDMTECLKILLAVLAGDIAKSNGTYTHDEQDGSVKVTSVVTTDAVARTIA